MKFKQMTHMLSQGVGHKLVSVICGLFFALVVIETVLRLGGWIFFSVQEYRNKTSVVKKNAYRIMCLGESTTAAAYPIFLQKELDELDIGIEFSVIDKGVPATNTSVILDNIEYNINSYNPDMIITMMGFNDGLKELPYGNFNIERPPVLRLARLIKIISYHLSEKSHTLHNKRIKNYDEEIDSVHGNFYKEEKYLKRAINLNPSNYQNYIKLGELYVAGGKPDIAENLFRKAIALNSNSDLAHFKLGWFLICQANFYEAEDLLQKAIKLNPYSYQAYFGLGVLFRLMSKLSEAEISFSKSIQLNPDYELAYLELGYLYRKQGKFGKAKTLFDRLTSPSADSLLFLASIYEEMGDSKSTKKYRQKALQSGANYINPITFYNYHRFKKVLDIKNIVLVCMQYPMRSIEPLRQIFSKQNRGIIFVDNEHIFKEAVRKGSYSDFFTDSFGGNFGHCTDKGNSLIAKNITKTILTEIFDK